MKTQNAGLLLVVSLLAACSSDSSGERQPVNRAPSISAIAETSTPANGPSQAINFLVSDESVESLTLSASSDRPDLVPSSAIRIDGTGSNRSLTITPVIDMTGDAMITVIAEDTAGLAASSSFLLLVDPEQKSMSQFARDTFVASEDDEPALINAVEFDQDADEDDFDDLLAQ